MTTRQCYSSYIGQNGLSAHKSSLDDAEKFLGEAAKDINGSVVMRIIPTFWTPPILLSTDGLRKER